MPSKKEASEAVAHELADEVLSNLVRDIKDVPIGELFESLIKRSVHNMIHSTYTVANQTVSAPTTKGFRPGKEPKKTNDTVENQDAKYWYSMYQDELKKVKQ